MLSRACLCALVISCSLFCGWRVDDEDDMEDDEVDESGEDWVESSPLDLKIEGVRSHESDCILSFDIDPHIGAGGSDGSIWRLPIDLNLSFARAADPAEFPLPSLTPPSPSGFVSTVAPPISLLAIPMKECLFFTCDTR